MFDKNTYVIGTRTVAEWDQLTQELRQAGARIVASLVRAIESGVIKLRDALEDDDLDTVNKIAPELKSKVEELYYVSEVAQAEYYSDDIYYLQSITWETDNALLKAALKDLQYSADDLQYQMSVWNGSNC